MIFLQLKKIPIAINPARIGHNTHVAKIVVKTLKSVVDPVKRFQPIIAPTIACVVGTGRPNLVIKYTERPATNYATKAPGKALIAPSLPIVSVVPLTLITAPSITKILQTIAAVLKLTILVPTAVPKTFAASLAPKDQPRNRPPSKKKVI